MNGKPYQIISGEMHYPRVPREYWHDRMKKARAMGLNTITTYVFWNLHEPRPGVYDFSGQLDVASYIRAAQAEGLNVILRPGPYVCAEWDLGGLPAWLLADPHMVLRSNEPEFMQPVERWLKRLGKELAPLQITHGGPIIAVQVENEYGSFDHDKQYMQHIQNVLIAAGLGEVLMYTADGPDQLKDGTLPGVQAVVNFGPGDAHKAFAALAQFRADQPMMAGEYWDGWFDSWGIKHHSTNAQQQEEELDWILSKGYSISLYMFHGGTTFGFMNGANYDEAYTPETTSYDYDAALDESGRPTSKYMAFREIIHKRQPNAAVPDVPASSPPIAIPRVALTESSSLWDNLGTPIRSPSPLPMEQIGQSYGFILYRTTIEKPAEGELRIQDLYDYAKVFVNGKSAGTIDRRMRQTALPVHVQSGDTLDILAENCGRINFGKRLRQERKGITQSVTLAGQELRNWQVFGLPMGRPGEIKYKRSSAAQPAFYRASFQLDEPGDTFLDTRALGKGVAWINGHLLGRFWSIGPQQTLYVPGPWMQKGTNEVVTFDLEAPANPSVQGLDKPILDELKTVHGSKAD